MIEEIRIGSLGVIESSVLELGPGLTVLTGETGAGKTMIVTALGLLRGGRADSGAVRLGARSARVEGIVRASAVHHLAASVDELGGEVEDDRVVLARTVGAEGRSRAFVGGATVPASALASLAEPLVAVHGQADQFRLLRSGAQREALDDFGGEPVGGPRRRWRDRFARLVAVEAELAEVAATTRERAREADLLRFGLGEIDAVAPQVGEEESLAAEEARLAAADSLRAAAELAREALSSEHDHPDALAAVSAARRQLDRVADVDREAAELASRLAELSYLLSDLAADVASYAAGLESDPVRLAAVSDRRAALATLTRKYGDTVTDVLAWAERAAARLADLDGTDDLTQRLRGERRSLRAELAEVGASLTAARRDAAGRLAAAVTAELVQLAMPDARLEVTVEQAVQPPVGPPDGPTSRSSGGAPAMDPIDVAGRALRPGAWGFDEVTFLLRPHAGSELRSLGRGASGGELSRVMLALEVALAGTRAAPTLVFDEVDAGVGGRAAVEVGRRLAILARRAQVLVVTHLPQVAAYADRHIVVHKSSDGVVTTSGLAVLDDRQRVRELSRMLAGLEDSDTAHAHARELLETARAER